MTASGLKKGACIGGMLQVICMHAPLHRACHASCKGLQQSVMPQAMQTSLNNLLQMQTLVWKACTECMLLLGGQAALPLQDRS